MRRLDRRHLKYPFAGSRFCEAFLVAEGQDRAPSYDFAYKGVVLDWFSRRVLSWRLSITLDGRPRRLKMLLPASRASSPQIKAANLPVRPSSPTAFEP